MVGISVNRKTLIDEDNMPVYAYNSDCTLKRKTEFREIVIISNNISNYIFAY